MAAAARFVEGRCPLSELSTKQFRSWREGWIASSLSLLAMTILLRLKMIAL